jgi:hypothetical protein
MVQQHQTGESSVAATIIDHREVDPARSTAIVHSSSADSPEARRLAEARRSSAGSVPGSLADAQRLRVAEALAKQAEAHELLERARAAEAKGQAGVARVYDSNAAKRAEGPLRDEAISGWRRLQGPQKASLLRGKPGS